MSVRLRKWSDADGKQHDAWLVDVVFTHPDGRVQRVKKFSPVDTRRGAEQYERELRASLLSGAYGKSESPIPTVADFAPRFLTYSETNNKPSTSKTKRDIVRKHLEPAFGKKTLDQVDTAAIERFKSKKLAEGLSPKSVNNVLTVLRNMLATAKEFCELREVPPVRWLKAPKPEIDFLTFDEAEKISQAAEAGRWRSMIVLALNTGLRIGELSALGWDCVDLTVGRLVVRRNVYRGTLGTPKGGRPREVPLNDRALQALRDAPRAEGCPWVFPQRDGQFIRNPQHHCAEVIHRQAARAGLRPIGWHTLRHTFASHLVMRGVSLKAVQELMGHATIEMTMRYAHLMPNVARDAVKTLDSGPLTAHAQSSTP